jgi:hypothetical protein
VTGRSLPEILQSKTKPSAYPSLHQFPKRNHDAEPGSRANDHTCHGLCLRTARAMYGRGSLVTLGRIMNDGGTVPKQFSIYLAAAYAIAGLTIASVPVHPWVTCETSGAIAGVSILAPLSTTLLGVLAPKDRPRRYLPAILSLLGMLVHPIFAH